MSRAVLLVGLALLFATSCAAPPVVEDVPADSRTDAPPEDNGDLELGEGRDTFAAIADGQTLLLARGCQGSQHVWISLRLNASYQPRPLVVSLALIRIRDELEVSLPFLVSLVFPTVDGVHAMQGLTLQVPRPELALGEGLRVIATVRDRTGRVARSEHRVELAWGSEVCGS